LTTLRWLWNCSNVTDVGLQELTFLARPRSPGALGVDLACNPSCNTTVLHDQPPRCTTVSYTPHPPHHPPVLLLHAQVCNYSIQPHVCVEGIDDVGRGQSVRCVKGHIVNLYDVSRYLYACRTSLNLPMCCAAHIVKLTIRTVPATVCFRAGQGQRLCTHLAITWVEEGVATNFTP
jgi:hypothetical protein